MVTTVPSQQKVLGSVAGWTEDISEWSTTSKSKSYVCTSCLQAAAAPKTPKGKIVDSWMVMNSAVTKILLIMMSDWVEQPQTRELLLEDQPCRFKYLIYQPKSVGATSHPLIYHVFLFFLCLTTTAISKHSAKYQACVKLCSHFGFPFKVTCIYWTVVGKYKPLYFFILLRNIV